MAMKKKRSVKTKAKKKILVKILAPKLFQEKVVGEAFATVPTDIVGKQCTANLMPILGDMRKQSLNASLRITQVDGAVAHTELIGLEMTASATKRLGRKRRNKIDDSFIAHTSGKGKVRIKPVTITMGRCSKAVQTALRLKVREQLKELVGKYRFEDFVSEALSFKIQKPIKETSKIIYPVKTIDIRVIKLLSDEEKGAAKPAPKVEPEEPKPVVKEEPKPETKEESKPEIKEKPEAEQPEATA